MSIEINALRQSGAELHGIPMCNDHMTFFYDETGNCGKFSLREEGVNDPTALKNDFILGGVAYDGDTCPADIESLFAALNLKSEEMKIRNICRSKDFMSFIGSKRATAYIDWLYNSGLYIHYAALNNLYYALVDMVDSLWDSQPQFAFSFGWAMQLKSALYRFCKEHLDEVLPLLHRFHYPNLERENTQDFADVFCNLIRTYNDETTQQGFLIECFRQMLKYAGRQGELVFLHDNESNVLVEEYYTLYIGRCYTYKYSIHHFDFEKVILAKMQSVPLMDNENIFVNYDFLDSKNNPLIQVSDVLVGLLSRLFEYLDAVTFDDITRMNPEEGKTQLSNLKKIFTLISQADNRHQMMIQNINDVSLIQERMGKLQMLIHMAE
ncbi:MAG: DUF3800 domain-containing protein [Agathobacter sp.]